MTPLARALAITLLAASAAWPAVAAKQTTQRPAAAKRVPTGSVCGTIRLDTGYGGPAPAHLADIVRLVAVDAERLIVGRARYGREKTRDAFRLLPYRIDGLPLGRRLSLAAAVTGPLGSPPPATAFAWSGVLQPGATTPHGQFALSPGPCLRADYALQLVEAPPSVLPVSAPTLAP